MEIETIDELKQFLNAKVPNIAFYTEYEGIYGSLDRKNIVQIQRGEKVTYGKPTEKAWRFKVAWGVADNFGDKLVTDVNRLVDFCKTVTNILHWREEKKKKYESEKLALELYQSIMYPPADPKKIVTLLEEDEDGKPFIKICFRESE